MMQHQYWVTKKTVLSKLGTKEDECIVASDAELDAKLELFRSISDSCLELQRVLDQYQQRLCILAQEENSLGKFLREAGKSNDAAGKHMVSAGKAVSYSGQQRLGVRAPLLRLYHEVETFRCRAVKDMRATVSAMEKARIEYRAALSWMKSTCAQLDPDTGRGLDNFRKAQRQVRESKKIFDKLTLDVLQKIDLLAAARCNMFSHVLSSYQNSFMTFASKVSHTLTTTVDTMNAAPQYEFNILKSTLGKPDIDQGEEAVQDKDQMLFFQDEYKDEQPQTSKAEGESKTCDVIQNKLDNEGPSTSTDLINTASEPAEAANSNINSDLAGLNLEGDMPAHFGLFMPTHLLQNINSPSSLGDALAPQPINDGKITTFPEKAPVMPMPPKKDDKAAWFKLFAELDPLANPDNLPGSNSNQSHAA